MIKDDNYITVLGWMCTRLKLKGNALLVYAIIYGFCQDGESCYHGSLQYLCDFTNSTRQGIINTLSDLVSSGLIIKEQGFPNNKCKVNVNKIYNDVNKVYNECKQSLQNNKEYNKDNIKDNISEANPILGKEKKDKKEKIDSEVASIVAELNSVWGTSFRASTSTTIKLIKARLKEGYTREDFTLVINDRWEKWGKKPVQFSNGSMSNTYLRPSTIFSPKMENYLEEARQSAYSVVSCTNVTKSEERDEDRSDLEF